MRIIEEIDAERLRQKDKEGYSADHDDHHNDGSLADAAVCYTSLAAAQARGANTNEFTPEVAHEMGWPWSDEDWKPKDQKRNLIRAAALIVAELERLDRGPQRR